MKNLFSVLIMFPFLTSWSQELQQLQQPKRNSIYFEAFGQGFYNSFAFDRLYRIDKNIKTSVTLAVTLIPIKELFVVGLPLSYNFIFGKKSNHLELGLGVTPMIIRFGDEHITQTYTDVNGLLIDESFRGHHTDFYSYTTAKIGYRIQKHEGGFFFRLTVSPSFAGINKEGETKGGNTIYIHKNKFEYFKGVGPTGFKVVPWAGISFGYTLKK